MSKQWHLPPYEPDMCLPTGVHRTLMRGSHRSARYAESSVFAYVELLHEVWKCHPLIGVGRIQMNAFRLEEALLSGEPTVPCTV